MLGDLAFVTDGDAQELPFRQVSQQLAHHRGHWNEGGQDRMHFRWNERGVDRVPGRLPIQNRQHLLGCFYGDVSLGFFS